jgi:hypothetical protein
MFLTGHFELKFLREWITCVTSKGSAQTDKYTFLLATSAIVAILFF